MTTPFTPHDLQKICVLIVEDSGYTSRLLKTVLDQLGVGKVIECAEVQRVHQSIREAKPDIVILDRYLQRMDGLNLLRQIRRSAGPSAAVPVILLSAAVTREEVVAARDAGTTEFLAKPVSARAVQERVVHCLSAPRPFVSAKSFRGPDRRRRLLPHGGNERRTTRRAPAVAAD